MSAVTWTPDRWNHNLPSALLMYNSAQLQNSIARQDTAPCRVWISNVAGANVIASSSTSHDATACHPVEPLLYLWPAFHGVPFCEPATPCYSWWLFHGGKKNLCSRFLYFFFFSVCQQKPEHTFVCSHRSRCVSTPWESVVVTWKEADTQVTAKGDRTFKGNIKAVMWKSRITGVAKSEATDGFSKTDMKAVICSWKILTDDYFVDIEFLWILQSSRKKPTILVWTQPKRVFLVILSHRDLGWVGNRLARKDALGFSSDPRTEIKQQQQSCSI